MTQHWSGGYATDLGYTFGYYPELNPLRAEFVLLLEGHEPPPPGPCCELGFGQGVSFAMHAAGMPQHRWWGTDLMPAHVRHARRLLDAAGVGAVAAAQDFAEFCARDDLPEFSFIGLHGVWNWVSEDSRRTIVDFVRRRLAPGGVLYTGCNTLPGWAASLPLRQLLRDHVRLAAGGDVPAADRVRAAVAFARRVFGADSTLVEETPALRQRAEGLAAQPVPYLLHEYLNRDWAPMAFTELAERLDAAQLVHAASADLLERLHTVLFTAEQIEIMASVAHPALRESLRDLFRGQRFRRDLWVRGAGRLTRQEQIERLAACQIVLAVGADDVPRTIPGRHAEAELQDDVRTLIVDALVQADGPLPMAQLFDRLAAHGIDIESGVGVVSMLVGAQAVHPAQSAAAAALARPGTDRLNAHLLHAAPAAVEVPWLASPVSGGGVRAPATLQLLLCAHHAAPSRPDSWAGRVWAMLQDGDQPLIHDGQQIADRGAALALLEELAQTFGEQTLPALRRLQIAG
jgi:SAM-dependent methyltransferase